jgi:hypothetical protein
MKQTALLLFLLLSALQVNAQERPLNIGLSIEEQHAFIGMMLSDVIDRFGPPRTVAAVRGIELWQDDVVFQYTGVDFYILRDRVWQVRFNTTHGISNGEPKASVLLTLGSTAEDKGDHVFMPIAGKNWPLTLRVNINDTGRVSAIFLYRTDF